MSLDDSIKHLVGLVADVVELRHKSLEWRVSELERRATEHERDYRSTRNGKAN